MYAVCLAKASMILTVFWLRPFVLRPKKNSPLPFLLRLSLQTSSLEEVFGGRGEFAGKVRISAPNPHPHTHTQNMFLHMLLYASDAG